MKERYAAIHSYEISGMLLRKTPIWILAKREVLCFVFFQVNDGCNVGEEPKRLLVLFIDHRENQDLDDDYSS
jgi:hypothetical protein